ncbi:Urb2/Npa2 family-domain-containing protein [Podospora appendiculata]|uniref:Urb2/Npa2 family-domain-containing protein n=1 Tax=Podospora appendiculata TaxID=314037 RepID=A0AAE0XFS7_9PEZI|nr:Urb2/Npa2 family-domain-containing protein [Podospora appendiculata]
MSADATMAQVGDASLIKAVRALDQGDIETTPDKLERVWNLLSQQRGSANFHAAEEMLLRWLLKNMTGTSPAAERVRRYAPAWNIMGAVFALIPLFSLAKSLADRRFVSILQQTLKDVSKPQKQATQTQPAADSDVEMADASSPGTPTNSRKRKRSTPATFDPAMQRQAAGCLEAGEAVLEALRILLSRCDLSPADGPPNNRMGAEHIKSLFSSSAAEVMETLVPLLTLCGVAADHTEPGSSKGQSSWMETFNALWDLHLQSASDASDVAVNLSGLGMSLLGKLTGVPRQRALAIDAPVQERWARGLRRFLARNMILPSRSAYLNNKKSMQVIQVVVEMSAVSAATTYPVLFDLVSKSPRVFGDKNTKKDYENWVQDIFDLVLGSLKTCNREQSLPAVVAIMDMAAERETHLSTASLQSICKDYAIREDTFEWKLLLSLVKLKPDVFLMPGGEQFLDHVLRRTRESETMTDQDFDTALQFVVLLAEGYANARDLSSFFKTWLSNLAVAEHAIKLERLWSQRELVTAVARLLEGCLNTNQLVEILDWFASRTEPAECLARIHILGAISLGISQEEFVDAANIKTFDVAFLEKFSEKEPSAVSVSRWTIAEKSLSRGTLEEAGRIWSQVKPDLKQILKKASVHGEPTFAAFKSCVAAWIANHPGGADEEDAAAMACSFIDRVEESGEPMADSDDVQDPITKGTYVSWMLTSAPRLVSLVVKRTGVFPNLILSLISLSGDENAITFDSALTVSHLVLENENNTNNQKLISGLVDQMISLVDTTKNGGSLASTRVAVQFLLDVPADIMARQQREATMERLILQLPQNPDVPESIGTGYWQPVLSLMVKLMEKPTFYVDMGFAHLETIGKSVFKIHRKSKTTDEVLKAREDFRLLGQLATLTIRQMASSSLEDREKAYLADAIAALQSPCSDSEMVPRLVLLHSFISVVQGSQALARLKESGLDLDDLKAQHLLQGAKPLACGKWKGRALLPFLTALEVMDVLDHETIKRELSGAVPTLLKAAERLLDSGCKAGWEVRMFLAKHFVEQLESPLRIKLPSLASADSDDEAAATPDERISVPTTVDKTTMLQYVDVVIRGVDEDTKLKHLKELLLEDSKESDPLGRLFVIYRLVQHLSGSRPQAPTPSSSDFDLGQAHSLLCEELLRTTTTAQFILAAMTLHLLLEQKAAWMTQWNIDLTLSSVSAACSAPAMQPLLAASPKAYQWLCRLVEMVIKRHRKRLDGHFHVLITALQSLIRRLLSSQPPSGKEEEERHAKLFSRLITLVCEPSVASVSRSHATASTLDSEKDKAKRYAGQYMYLVLMQYVKLQLEHVVPHGVREALETGMHSVLDITTPDGLRIMNDGMDPSGRVIFRELYKQYQKFGKWSGI